MVSVKKSQEKTPFDAIDVESLRTDGPSLTVNRKVSIFINFRDHASEKTCCMKIRLLVEQQKRDHYSSRDAAVPAASLSSSALSV